MAAQPEASTVVRATVEGSTVVVAPLREAATEVVAAATVAESTHSIQLILLNRDGQAGSTLPLAQFRPSFGSPRLSLLSFPPRRSYLRSTGI